MTPTAKFFVLTIGVMTACLVASAQNPVVDAEPNGEAIDSLLYSSLFSTPPDSAVSEVRKERSWEYAPFVNYGNGIGGDRSNYHFFSLGVEAGKILTPPIHAGILSGQFQLAVNIMPFWQAYTPAPHDADIRLSGCDL